LVGLLGVLSFEAKALLFQLIEYKKQGFQEILEMVKFITQVFAVCEPGKHCSHEIDHLHKVHY
jgi:hypothetical protein